MDRFGKTVSETRKLDAIDKMKLIKHQIDLAKQRITQFAIEIEQLNFEIKEMKSEILKLYKDNFEKDES